MNTTPIAVLVTLAKIVGRGETRLHTKRSEVHQAWKGDNPVFFGIDDVTTIELEGEPTLSAPAIGCEKNSPEGHQPAKCST